MNDKENPHAIARGLGAIGMRREVERPGVPTRRGIRGPGPFK
ncbi:hypothetical protein [Paraburkholderia fungorum]|jgi:hypothetical protein|uniref:Uncharacterized protein n=1 Tax=Paraburkholderia fungorum TaxID=134537 RepID=A0AAW3V9Q0_9BURK|nr:hypothetical protein [Paraburkholderia fungorum]MBB4518982.1 hypothetical protein [Paraburkholderia fungorum]MBB6206811.1 hypothetical protein [Paraburkholderia fungorum]